MGWKAQTQGGAMTDTTDIVQRLHDIADKLEDACVAGEHAIGSVADCTSPVLRSIAARIAELEAENRALKTQALFDRSTIERQSIAAMKG